MCFLLIYETDKIVALTTLKDIWVTIQWILCMLCSTKLGPESLIGVGTIIIGSYTITFSAFSLVYRTAVRVLHVG